MKVIELHRSITASNDADAGRLRAELKKEGTLLVNLMSSPGSGKTTLLKRTIADLAAHAQLSPSIGVLEADIASDVDARSIEAAGAKSIQAHTDGMCHMDAGMTRAALESLGGSEDLPDIVFLENVGNLICPAEFDTGAAVNVMILSVPEGDDKPLKYPLMFEKSDALLITKTDAMPWFDFDLAAASQRAKELNPKLAVFPVSAKTGEGMDAWEDWLLDRLQEWKEPADA